MHFPILVVCFERLFWKCFLGWWCFRWRLWFIKYIENNTWARRDMEFPLDISRVNTKRAIPYLQAIMCYFYSLYKYFTNKKKRLNSRFKKRTRCLSFMALNRASDVPLADCHLKHTWKIIVIFHVWWYVWWRSPKTTPVYIVKQEKLAKVQNIVNLATVKS